MFKLVTDLLMHKQLNFKEGSVQLLNQEVAFFPVPNLFEMQKLIEEAGKTNELYLASKKLGKDWITNLFKQYDLKTIKEQADWGHNVFTLAGMGKMNVVDWDTDAKRMTYEVEDSIMAKYYGKTGKAVDTIARGWFAGATSVFFQTDVDAIEVKCKSKGDEHCVFIVQPKEKFDFNDPIVKEQLRK